MDLICLSPGLFNDDFFQSCILVTNGEIAIDQGPFYSHGLT